MKVTTSGIERGAELEVLHGICQVKQQLLDEW